VPPQPNYNQLYTRTIRKVSCLNSQASTVASTVCMLESSKLQQLQALFACPESPKLQQPQTPFACPHGSQASTDTDTVCSARDVIHMARDVVHFLNMTSTCRGSSEKITDPKTSTEGSDAMHLHKDSPRLNDQSHAEQLQRQQKMVKLLMKQIEKEQERCHSLEDALLEHCSCVCPCRTTGKCQLKSDSGPGH